LRGGGERPGDEPGRIVYRGGRLKGEAGFQPPGWGRASAVNRRAPYQSNKTSGRVNGRQPLDGVKNEKFRFLRITS
jgi:hypothetical protein